MKLASHKYSDIVNYNELEKYCESKSIVPEDQEESYVVFYTINEYSERFTVIWSSQKLLNRINKRLTQDDATYKLNWNDFPVFVSGVSSPGGVFHQTHMALSSHEDTEAWSVMFNFVKSIILVAPKFVMADGAWEITNAVRSVFEDQSIRLMCWSHTYRCLHPKLKGIRKINKELGNNILNTIKEIQRLVTSREEFYYTQPSSNRIYGRQIHLRGKYRDEKVF